MKKSFLVFGEGGRKHTKHIGVFKKVSRKSARKGERRYWKSGGKKGFLTQWL